MVVAAGSGRRFGAAKQFEELCGERVVDRAVRTAAACCEGVVVVLPAGSLGTDLARIPHATSVVAGGLSRTESSRHGVDAVPASAEVVLVHDGARPLASGALFGRVIAAVRAGAEAVVPVVPVTDTIRNTRGELVERDDLRAVQTPQGFPAEVIRRALGSGAEATDDAALVAAGGAEVTMVEGEVHNLKVTTPVDLEVARMLAARPEAAG